MSKRSIDELLVKKKLIEEMVEIINNPILTGYSKAYYLRNVAIQTWTEHYPVKSSKHEGCKYWSAQAFKQVFERDEYTKAEPLLHEHVIPKEFLIKNIFLSGGNGPVDYQYIEHYLNEYTFACVLTKSENSRINAVSISTMPPEFMEIKNENYLKGWLRYSRAGIDVYEVKWNDKVPVKKRKVDTDNIQLV
ncbi:hypothetical protein [Bacillus sp. EB01]|uniref:hypothetical protein n=1 Tax=Bacillus sp. EB01 TaxID=1347086 RepID=UPI0005C62E1B|nr:hypothetical protein [Bacillus sp. EB01]